MSLKSVKSLLLLCILLFAGSGGVQAQNDLFWGDLQPGRYAVGFRTLYQMDYTRLYDTTFPTLAKPNEPKPFRPLFIAVWYPAKKTNAERMVFKDYLAIDSKDPKVAAFSQRLKTRLDMIARQEFITYRPVAEWKAEETAAWDKIVATRAYSVKNAAPAQGRFPLVIYHPGIGGGYEDNFALFEYLASHGYVVLSSAYQAEDAAVPFINWELPRSFKDLTLLLQYAKTLPNVDAERLAVMGQSFGGQAVFGWRAETNSPVEALVSFDSGMETANEEEFATGYKPLKAQFEASAEVNTDSVITPILCFGSAEDKPKFEMLDKYLKFAPRYKAITTSLKHNDYVTHGAVQGTFFPRKEEGTAGGKLRRESYDNVCRHVLAFFDFTLKRDAAGEAYLKQSLKESRAEGKFTLRYQAPAALPPTAGQLTHIIEKQGVAAAEMVLRQCRNDLSPTSLYLPIQLLMDADKKENFLRLNNLCMELLPNSAFAYEQRAKFHEKYGEKEKAIAAYQKALELIPADPIFLKYESSRKYVLDEWTKALAKLKP